jgi:hypothetical protein
MRQVCQLVREASDCVVRRKTSEIASRAKAVAGERMSPPQCGLSAKLHDWTVSRSDLFREFSYLVTDTWITFRNFTGTPPAIAGL